LLFGFVGGRILGCGLGVLGVPPFSTSWTTEAPLHEYFVLVKHFQHVRQLLIVLEIVVGILRNGLFLIFGVDGEIP
jgi:hypothetical protein